MAPSVHAFVFRHIHPLQHAAINSNLGGPRCLEPAGEICVNDELWVSPNVRCGSKVHTFATQNRERQVLESCVCVFQTALHVAYRL